MRKSSVASIRGFRTENFLKTSNFVFQVYRAAGPHKISPSNCLPYSTRTLQLSFRLPTFFPFFWKIRNFYTGIFEFSRAFEAIFSSKSLDFSDFQRKNLKIS
ncbi:Protein CBG25087 [Caenorhabditis briggsae]|uniref:Protein CBG16452 n=1 Tax=Caenorhabditis briggsae TaxID=6238 RepID=G2J6W7_CAEBR|nr:Protein CBG16452 [Caenorhabditis briggsae]XP_002648700.1 Protein CBG25087 [Caenorhabditis briggsae]CAP21532.1 Protein CBG25087 [Caenorhabditis briggsae]CAP34415.1 Protein CBG16452 [Caenorhabditis briggsae]